MLKRLRSAHPMLYCLVAEVLFLGMLFVASLLSLLLILFVVRDIDAVDDYMLTFMQEAVGVLVAWLFLARTGKSGLLRRRGSGFFNGLLVGLYPIALIGYNAYNTLLFGRPEGDMLPAWHVVWFLIGMTSVGVAEEYKPPMSMDVMSIAAWMNTVTQMFPVRKYTAASSVPSEAAKTHCIRTPSGALPVRLVRWAAPK